MLRSKFTLEVWKEKTVYKIIAQELLPKSAFGAAVSRMESTSLTSDPPTGMLLLWLELFPEWKRHVMLQSRSCHATATRLFGSLWWVVIFPLRPSKKKAIRALVLLACTFVIPGIEFGSKPSDFMQPSPLVMMCLFSFLLSFCHSSSIFFFFIFCSQELMTSFLHKHCALSFTKPTYTFYFLLLRSICAICKDTME